MRPAVSRMSVALVSRAVRFRRPLAFMAAHLNCRHDELNDRGRHVRDSEQHDLRGRATVRNRASARALWPKQPSRAPDGLQIAVRSARLQLLPRRRAWRSAVTSGMYSFSTSDEACSKASVTDRPRSSRSCSTPGGALSERSRLAAGGSAPSMPLTRAGNPAAARVGPFWHPQESRHLGAPRAQVGRQAARGWRGLEERASKLRRRFPAFFQRLRVRPSAF